MKLPWDRKVMLGLVIIFYVFSLIYIFSHTDLNTGEMTLNDEYLPSRHSIEIHSDYPTYTVYIPFESHSTDGYFIFDFTITVMVIELENTKYIWR